MNVIQCGASFATPELQDRLFDGDIVIVEPTASSLRLAELARDVVWEAFAPLNPVDAHRSLSPDEYDQVVQVALARFETHPEVRSLLARLLAELDCDVSQTLVDTPRLDVKPDLVYLGNGTTTPAAPRRDTWCAAPQMQINWWIPILDMNSGNGITFYPDYWERPVENTSRMYSYDEHEAACRDRSVRGGLDKARPTATVALHEATAFRPVVEPGGIILFSAAHLHGTTPNHSGQTRFSVTFNTVDATDVTTNRGAKNVDSEATGTTLHSFANAEAVALPKGGRA